MIQFRPLRQETREASGFTLIELVAVIALLGIIAAIMGILIKGPVDSYFATVRRAELADSVDTAVRRMGRDIRLALPNSVRVTTSGGTQYLEFLATRTGGRYRAQRNATPAGDILDFTVLAGDNSFDQYGAFSAASGQTIVAGDILVIQNLFSASGVTQSNAYTYNQGAFNCTNATPSATTCNTAAITGTGAGSLPNENKINFAARQFPQPSAGNRFHVVSGPVTYICVGGSAGGNGTGTLTRVSNYTIQINQPTAVFAGAPVTALLAQNVSSCTITYDSVVLTQNHGLVSIQLQLTRGNETVSLYDEVHVSNLP